MVDKQFLNAIKDQLKKDYPDYSEEQIDSTAKAISEMSNKKSKKKIDESGKIIVGENVRLILESNIISTGNIKED